MIVHSRELLKAVLPSAGTFSWLLRYASWIYEYYVLKHPLAAVFV